MPPPRGSVKRFSTRVPSISAISGCGSGFRFPIAAFWCRLQRTTENSVARLGLGGRGMQSEHLFVKRVHPNNLQKPVERGDVNQS